MSRRRLRHGGRRASRGTPVNLARLVDYYGRFLAPIPPKQRWRVNGFTSPRAMRLDRERRLADVRRTQERNRAKREAT